MNNAAPKQTHTCKVGAIKKKKKRAKAKDLLTAYFAKQTYHHARGITLTSRKLFSALTINN